METREMLEGQLERARRRGDRVMDLEAEILKLKQLNNELSLVRNCSLDILAYLSCEGRLLLSL